MQKFSSKETSLNQVPALAKFLDIHEGVVLLDYGCGKFDKFKKFVLERGGTFFGYDKYWKSDVENEEALSSSPTIVTCANVLNVILEEEIIEEIVLRIAQYGVPAVFQVYEGNKSCIGSETSRGYQRNERAVCYLSILEKHFDVVRKKGNIFFCNFF